MNIYSYVDKTRANANGSYPVYIIIRNAKGRFFINTGITTTDKLINGLIFPKSDPLARQKTTVLSKYMSEVETLCLQNELMNLDKKELKTIIQDKVFGIFQKEKTNTLAEEIENFTKLKNKSTSILYNITKNKVLEYDKDIKPDEITPEWLESFRQDCLKKGMKINGVGKELRNIRAVMNWLRKNGKTNNYPFNNYSIIEEETLPNNLSAEAIKQLQDYPCEQWQKKYIDFFILSFCLAGINPGDLLLLKKSDVKNKHISFVRKKTDKQGSKKIRIITLPITPEAAQIIKTYQGKKEYLLNFMDERKEYSSFIKECNKALKKIGPQKIVADKLGKMRKIEYHPIFPNITLYSARYSFGSIAANDLDISEQTIGMCLGHSWTKQVTARYISYDQKKIDNAVKKVIEYVFKDKT